ncbi:hypothetical protein LAZ67_7000063 [Cordylochernes scorpioides]|uniref:Uncharacterized protein n=1 Tax=Cordylochernes scorpioides TaxID=51811 RepID=A0ABY6KLP1_9ARAC|nr:hypothetical protein LAZ67_7000063 [Cordylochernes scorpioides]
MKNLFTYCTKNYKCIFISLYDKPRSGRPSTATNPENEDKVDDLLRHDRRITIRELCNILNVGSYTIETMIEHLSYRKICSECVPRKLTPVQLTGDETLAYLYDPETKAQELRDEILCNENEATWWTPIKRCCLKRSDCYLPPTQVYFLENSRRFYQLLSPVLLLLSLTVLQLEAAVKDNHVIHRYSAMFNSRLKDKLNPTITGREPIKRFL